MPPFVARLIPSAKIGSLLQSKRVCSTPSCSCPVLPHSYGGAGTGFTVFDTGFTAIQSLFTGTIAKVARLVAIVIGGYGLPTANPAQRRLWPASPPEPGLPFSP